MGLGAILEIISGVLKFPGVILEFVRLLKKSPAEKHDDIIKKIQEEAAQFEDSGRPDWS